MANTALKAVSKNAKVDTGISDEDRKEIAGKLEEALADSYILYLKTLGVHWNVVGPAFYSLHKLTEEQYNDLHAAIDAIAERIRSLGQIAPASFGEFAKTSELESAAIPKSADKMVEALIADNEAIAKRLRDSVEIADGFGDVFTADMLTARIGQHEENVWMLRSMSS
ncbi:Dps family protein [Sphingorhabdus arenilitoris]|uniref:Dps family protein n=1 Tax=Sphingorhabdus arenilitoris TaxID=1490041 RepID=A0ABV8REX4_9SPHN